MLPSSVGYLVKIAFKFAVSSGAEGCPRAWLSDEIDNNFTDFAHIFGDPGQGPAHRFIDFIIDIAAPRARVVHCVGSAPPWKGLDSREFFSRARSLLLVPRAPLAAGHNIGGPKSRCL